jgi:anti-sigma factor RsiW
MWWWRSRHCTDGTLVALLDDELDLLGQTTARRHVAGCDACSSRLQRQQAANAALTELLAPHASPALPVPSNRRFLSSGVAGAGLLVASVGAIVAAGIVVRRRRHHIAAALDNGRS